MGNVTWRKESCFIMRLITCRESTVFITGNNSFSVYEIYELTRLGEVSIENQKRLIYPKEKNSTYFTIRVNSVEEIEEISEVLKKSGFSVTPLTVSEFHLKKLMFDPNKLTSTNDWGVYHTFFNGIFRCELLVKVNIDRFNRFMKCFPKSYKRLVERNSGDQYILL